jgi:NADPH2:quinone reductase
MRATVLEKFGGPDSLVIKEIPEPEPRAVHVVIQGVRHQSRRDAYAPG